MCIKKHQTDTINMNLTQNEANATINWQKEVYESKWNR